MNYRTEKEFIRRNNRSLPIKLWGAQTQRSLENFQIGTEKIPQELVTVFAYLKKAAAETK